MSTWARYGIWIPSRDAPGTGLGQVVAFTSDENLPTPSTTPVERLTVGPAAPYQAGQIRLPAVLRAGI
jgi:hypothetical protein